MSKRIFGIEHGMTIADAAGDRYKEGLQILQEMGKRNGLELAGHLMTRSPAEVEKEVAAIMMVATVCAKLAESYYHAHPEVTRETLTAIGDGNSNVIVEVEGEQ